MKTNNLNINSVAVVVAVANAVASGYGKVMLSF